MPNHVTTRCIVTGPADDIDAFVAKMIVEKTDDGEPFKLFDFEQAIPMPEILAAVTEGSDANLGFELITGAVRPKMFNSSYLAYPWVKDLGITTLDQLKAWATKERPNALVEGQKMLDAYKATGFYSWYDWSIKNWGTKWNSYSFGEVAREPGRYEFKFDTAWSFPQPVFDKVAAMFPTLKIEAVCFDEGWNFAATFDAEAGDGVGSFEERTATDELYERVYGEKPEKAETESTS